MTARMILIAASVFLSSLFLTAESASGTTQKSGRASRLLRNTATAADYADSARAQKLLDERKALVLKIHKLRMELIRKDPRLRRMYEQLIQQARELAGELESKKEMRNMTESLGEIDSRLNGLRKK